MAGLRPCSPGELTAFESAHRITLPEDYRDLLLNVGVSERAASWHDRYPLSHYDEWCQPLAGDEMPADFLRTPFPHSAPWNALDSAGEPDPTYFWEGHDLGSMRIINMGCELYYLLVVSGPERGAVWCDGRANRAGIYPLTKPDGGRVRVSELLPAGRWNADWQLFDVPQFGPTGGRSSRS